VADSNRWNSPEQDNKQTSHGEELGNKDIIDRLQRSKSEVRWVMREEVSRDHGIHGVQVVMQGGTLIDLLYVVLAISFCTR
jgi:hypothetical protein